jgi:lipoate-protein ligase A
MICRLLPYEVSDGPTNMAIDHALLDAVDADPSFAVLRTYGWSVPTLSLGYFQASSAARSDPRWRSCPLVRRPTGGGALWHDREITYALVLPRQHPCARRASDLYRSIHGALASMLVARELPAARRGDTACSETTKTFLCFLDHDPEDVLLRGVKVIGSAQRRRPRAVLQHGALLLARSTGTPELDGLRELGGPEAADAPWDEAVSRCLVEALDLRPIGSSLTTDERSEADRLAREVYRDPAWTDRR